MCQTRSPSVGVATKWIAVPSSEGGPSAVDSVGWPCILPGHARDGTSSGARLREHPAYSGHAISRATILGTGKTATGLEFPTEVVEGLGSPKQPPVRVTINGYTYRTTVATMGGDVQ